MANILFADDDPVVQQMGSRVLEDDGHIVDVVGDGFTVIEMLEDFVPDLLILDIAMPNLSGLEVCRRIRADPFMARLPVIFLTARSRPQDIADGLDAGADDYITKDKISVVLPARVRAMLRRVSGGALDPNAESIIVGELELHITRPELSTPDSVVFLTPIEHRLMHYLMQHAGQPISAERLLEDVWEYPTGTGDPKLVRNHIGNVRNKIEPDPHNPIYLRTVYGRGYVVGA